MKAFPKPNIRKWLRIIHRDLGYFTLGITLVYAFSGIILNHKKNSQDPAYKTLSFEQTIERSLKPSEVDSLFALLFPSYELKKILPENNRYSLFLKGGLGWYEPESGRLWLEVYRRKPFVYFVNKLHNNQKKYWTLPADFFAVSLIFFALSGLFMVRGKNGLAGRGKWLIAGGIILIIVYIWV